MMSPCLTSVSEAGSRGGRFGRRVDAPSPSRERPGAKGSSSIGSTDSLPRFVPLNLRLTGQELTYIIGDAGVHTLVAGPEHRELIEPVRTALPVRRYLAVEPAEDWEP
jgi:hypothetical protein